jgi:Flp pilus assembly protein TadD
MRRHFRQGPLLARSTRSVAIVGLLALATAACKTTGSEETTGSIPISPAPRSEAAWRQEIDVWGERYRKNPTDAEVAIRYADALRATGQRAQAVAVLEQAAIHNPRNRALLGAYGRALADAGSFKQALEVLNRAHTPDQPDWRILNVQGAVLDQMGRHDEARRHYETALKIAPNDPSVLSNLGLSYALSKDLPKAEETLRLAAAQKGAEPRVRQNLALVVGLQGRFAEAETIARGDLSPEEAAANVAYLRQMLAQKAEMKKLQSPARGLKTTGSS